jgi:[acyl-carrier-protein] S-malonyltransferase
MSIAWVFPGQGTQYVGMAKNLCDLHSVAREAIAQADDALGFALSQMIFFGPEEELRLTYNTQPAILACSVACARVLRETAPGFEPDYVAGHSVGEYTALVVSGALEYADALRLVRARGHFMDEAVPAGTGAMAAVIGADLSALEELCASIEMQMGEVVEVANVNCPGQLVVSGKVAAVAELVARAKEAGARRAVPLAVSGPFHSSLMEPARVKLEPLLDGLGICAGSAPLVANVTGAVMRDPLEIRAALAKQVARPVLWEASVRTMAELGVHTFVEVGPGTVLSGLIKKTVKGAKILHVEDEASLQQVLGQAMGAGR